MQPTFKQRLWLQSRGGRTPSDVISHQNKLFIEMNDAKGNPYLHEIPDGLTINLSLNKSGYVSAN